MRRPKELAMPHPMSSVLKNHQRIARAKQDPRQGLEYYVPFTTLGRVVKGRRTLGRLLKMLIAQKQWFAVEAQSDEQWLVTVRASSGPLLARLTVAAIQGRKGASGRATKAESA
jgi:hypothetical protein